MNHSGLMLALLNFGFIGSLPRVFFKDGRLTLEWWYTATPLLLCPLFLIATAAGWIPLLGAPVPWSEVLGLAAVVLNAGSIALVAFTLGTHRVRIALWHQAADAPVELVTYGAYARIRHPFYAAFLLALLGALLLAPSPATLLTLVLGFIAPANRHLAPITSRT
jgi:protein-S-isoprenylcysteine O-methyltransferase Ste14